MVEGFAEYDSKRSWLVCLGAMFVFGVSMGISNCFGVLFNSWTHEFRESRTKIAWVGSFHFIWYMLLSPVCGILTRRYSFRLVTFSGSIVLCLGLLVASFVNDVAMFYLTYSLIFASGTCLLFASAIIVIGFCFKKHFALASGLVLAANGGFVMWCGPVYEYLIRNHGWRSTLRIFVLLLIPLVMACLLFPGKREITGNRDAGQVNEPAVAPARLLRNKGFMTWLLIMFLVYIGLFIPQVHLISFCEDLGIPSFVSVYNITIMCATETACKIIGGKMIDALSWNVHTFNVFSILALAVSITLLPLASAKIHVFLFSGFYGCGLGIQSVCVINITPQLTHPNDAKHAVTYLFGALSIPGGLGPVFAAWIFDVTRSYDMAFFIAGGLFALAACLAVFIQSIALENTRVAQILLQDEEQP